MKKFLKILLIVIIMIAILIGEYIFYVYITKVNPNVEKEIFESETQDEEISNEKIFSLEELPRLDASLATQPLVSALVKNFTGDEFNQEEFSNTHPAYIKLIDGQKDLIVVTEPSEEELKYAKEKNVELEVIPVVREGFVFFVNEDNPVNNLTLEEIQKIYTGEITNWKELGGENEKIIPFQRPENSGSQTGMLSLVMKDKKIIEPEKKDLVETMEAIVNLVADYDNGEYAIGYSYYYYATTMFDTINKSVTDKIKFLKINGVEPNNETIKSQEYPLETAYYIVIRKDEPEDGAVRKMVDAMLSKRGQTVSEEVGYVGVR